MPGKKPASPEKKQSQTDLVLGEGTRKCQPRLRMIANGDVDVNSVRAEHCASIRVTDDKALKQAPVRTRTAAPVKRDEVKNAKKGKLKQVTRSVEANVFIETLHTSGRKTFEGQKARRANLVTARLPLSKIREIAADDEVIHIELGEALATPTPEITKEKVSAPPVSQRRFGTLEQRQKAANVLIGIIDVQGFDFAHPDFLDEKGGTRFIRIWDQGGSNRPSPKGGQFDYGSEISRDHMNAAIAGAEKLKIPATDLEAQSQMDPGSHGTHVASVAAGNRGVCRDAIIAGVVVSLPRSSNDRRQSFYDSTRIADAVDYLIRLAQDPPPELNRKTPLRLSINVSLGTNGHAHDGSSAVSRWIDSAMSVPGRCISIAAGNAGQDRKAFEGDSGFIMGRIHTSGTMAGPGLAHDIEWLVVGNGIADLSENELEIWYSPQDRFAISIKPPNDEWIGPIEPRQFVENKQLKDASFLSIYNELYHPANGANYISVYLSPLLSKEGVVGISSGKWTVRLIGREVRDGRFHGWIERDDPRQLGRFGERQTWRFPSFFSETSNVDNSSVSSMACGQRVLSVANLDEAAERISITSSQGPTRDDRNKPDTAAPGTNVVAANGFAGPDDLWIGMSGTSMASPFVAGVAGLMLGLEPKLTAAQIEGIIIRTADPLPGGSFKWVNDAGFGRINPKRCLEETELINQRQDKTK